MATINTQATAGTQPAKYHTSLLTSLDCRGHVHLILGTNPLAASRCTQSLAAGATPIVIAPATDGTDLHYALQKRIDAGEVQWLRRAFEDADLSTLGRPEVGGFVDAVFVTAAGSRDPQSPAAHVSALCRRQRVPVNVVDSPALCTFSLLSTHSDGPLQVGVTTNGRGCKLASRIRREIAAALPRDLGAACARLGEVRRRVQEEDGRGGGKGGQGVTTDDDSYDQSASFNKLVTDADIEAAKTRRMRWLSQVCEYWPLKRLAAVTDADVDAVLASYHTTTATSTTQPTATPSQTHPNPSSSPTLPTPRGRIILAGSGPGHPDLVTLATHKALQTADVILADKLVPSGVLDLIPRRTPVSIARKFPGNADAAQQELISSALAAYQAGKTVLRLKQGDPFVTGAAARRLRRSVPPACPTTASRCCRRDVADQVLVCTGTGKKGKPPTPPGYLPSRTVVFLMALHRIVGLVGELTERTAEEESAGEEKRALWPRDTPCAVVERASCPDQRVIRTTLRHVAEAIEQEGSRPPGLLVVGRACEVLYTMEKGRAWVVEDGFKGMDYLDDVVAQGIPLLA
uniref:Siroheme synthase n=1 Tax=Pyricularia oryzae (strain P131) TaxID=1143193 RepID=L7J235_PYRO1